MEAGDIAGGITGQKQRAMSVDEYKQALNAADERKAINLKRQQNVSSETGRNLLLQNALGAQARRGGIRGLDNALLSNDQSGQLNALNNILRTNLRDIEGNVKSAETLGTDINTIAAQQAEAEKALNQRVTGLNTEYEKSLADRLPQINKAKSDQVQSLLDQFNQLRGNNEATESFAKQLGLDKVMGANPADVDPFFNVNREHRFLFWGQFFNFVHCSLALYMLAFVSRIYFAKQMKKTNPRNQRKKQKRFLI
jgi:hypothetical protein